MICSHIKLARRHYRVHGVKRYSYLRYSTIEDFQQRTMSASEFHSTIINAARDISLQSWVRILRRATYKRHIGWTQDIGGILLKLNKWSTKNDTREVNKQRIFRWATLGEEWEIGSKSRKRILKFWVERKGQAVNREKKGSHQRQSKFLVQSRHTFLKSSKQQFKCEPEVLLPSCLSFRPSTF